MSKAKTPRGTERAARRAGLHQGWRINGRGPKMQPAKNEDDNDVVDSTWSTNWAPDKAKRKAKGTPSSARIADALLAEAGTHLLARFVRPRRPPEHDKLQPFPLLTGEDYEHQVNDE